MLLSWFGPIAISLVLVAATALARTAAGKNFGKPQLLQHNAHRHVTTHALHLLKLAQGTSQRARSLTFTRSRGVGNGKYPDPTTGKVVPCLRKSRARWRKVRATKPMTFAGTKRTCAHQTVAQAVGASQSVSTENEPVEGRRRHASQRLLAQQLRVCGRQGLAQPVGMLCDYLSTPFNLVQFSDDSKRIMPERS